jgi:hypothetical protein
MRALCAQPGIKESTNRSSFRGQSLRTRNSTIVVWQSAYQVASDSTGVTEAVDTGVP